MNNKKTIWIVFLAAALLLTACQPAASTPAAGDTTLQVTVSILPQVYFVQRIGGSAVAVNVMVGPGEEAHTYEPTPDQMKALTHSDVFFSIGVEYEDAWIPRFQEINSDLWVVDSSAGIERIELTDTHEDETTAEDTADTHDHSEGLDPHVWLAPANGKLIAANVLTALQELAPDQTPLFQTNYDALIADIDALDAEITTTLEGLPNRTFMVFHPAWGYFADQYGLQQLSVQVGGQDPSVSEVADLVSAARENNIKVIFIQPTFSATDAEAIAQEIGGEVVAVDPLAKDWLANLQTVAKAFAAALNE